MSLAAAAAPAVVRHAGDGQQGPSPLWLALHRGCPCATSGHGQVAKGALPADDAPGALRKAPRGGFLQTPMTSDASSAALRAARAPLGPLACVRPPPQAAATAVFLDVAVPRAPCGSAQEPPPPVRAGRRPRAAPGRPLRATTGRRHPRRWTRGEPRVGSGTAGARHAPSTDSARLRGRRLHRPPRACVGGASPSSPPPGTRCRPVGAADGAGPGRRVDGRPAGARSVSALANPHAGARADPLSPPPPGTGGR